MSKTYGRWAKRIEDEQKRRKVGKKELRHKHNVLNNKYVEK